jgi:hypothetical protein
MMSNAMKSAIEELIEKPKFSYEISMNARRYAEKLDWLHIRTCGIPK